MIAVVFLPTTYSKLAALRRENRWGKPRPESLAYADRFERHHPEGSLGQHDDRSATDGDVFLAYVQQVLGPKLAAGQLVIMGNVPAHKVEGVREAIEARGARLVYWPRTHPILIPSNRFGPR